MSSAAVFCVNVLPYMIFKLLNFLPWIFRDRLKLKAALKTKNAQTGDEYKTTILVSILEELTLHFLKRTDKQLP